MSLALCIKERPDARAQEGYKGVPTWGAAAVRDPARAPGRPARQHRPESAV